MILRAAFLRETTITDPATGEPRPLEQFITQAFIVPERYDFVDEEGPRGQVKRGYLRFRLRRLGLWRRVNGASRLRIIEPGKTEEQGIPFAIRSVQIDGNIVVVEAETE